MATTPLPSVSGRPSIRSGIRVGLHSNTLEVRAWTGRDSVFDSRPCLQSPLDGKNHDHVYLQLAEVQRGGCITEANIHLECVLHLFTSTRGTGN